LGSLGSLVVRAFTLACGLTLKRMNRYGFDL
jgi:hypothetical protein